MMEPAQVTEVVENDIKERSMGVAVPLVAARYWVSKKRITVTNPLAIEAKTEQTPGFSKKSYFWPHRKDGCGEGAQNNSILTIFHSSWDRGWTQAGRSGG